MLTGLSVVLFGLCLVLDALVLLSDFFALSKLRPERFATSLVRCLHVLNVLCLELPDRFDLLIPKQLRVGFAMSPLVSSHHTYVKAQASTFSFSI